MQNKRTPRFRTEDHSSTANSVNPSPKKQPRLNITSPAEAREWGDRNPSTNEGSLRKRYKVESNYSLGDPQVLSDIQFIDSITPEHSIGGSGGNMIYACAQVHNPPSSKRSSIFDASVEQRHSLKAFSSKDRYSNPEANKHGERKAEKDGRYSYPGIGEKFAVADEKKYVCRFPVNNEKSSANANGRTRDPKNDVSLELSSASEHMKRNESEYSKLSIPTPSSPSKSPNYSLLVGETSSDNSSSLNTPVYDMEMTSAIMQFDQRMEGAKRQLHDAKDMHTSLLSEESDTNVSVPREFPLRKCANEFCFQQFGSRLLTSSGENEEMMALKSDLSLELGKSKMSVDDASLSSKQNINVSSASNTPNLTDSTSQSMTPSEFGYQHLTRPSNGGSPDNSPRSDMYESIEAAFKNYEQCVSGAPSLLAPRSKSKSPIKSTINITYNLRSPSRTPTKGSAVQESFLFPSDSEVSRESSQFSDYEPINVTSAETNSAKSLLETSFDDAGVYEQVKFFKGAVCEVNELVRNGNEPPRKSDGAAKSQIVPTIVGAMHKSGVVVPESQGVAPDSLTLLEEKSESDDVLMPEQELDAHDSLEFELNVSLYENVSLRKPKNVYENVEMREALPEVKTSAASVEAENDTSAAGKENSKPKNFTVRQLANKFETSPVDALPPFDFSKQFVRKSCDSSRSAASANKAKADSVQLPDQVKNLDRITRSLDENAFVREFGGGRLNEKINRSTHQISNVANVLTENSPSRRTATENPRPKSLNPPKRLPLMDDEFCKADGKKECPTVELKITPTTENPISLIQHNVHFEQAARSLDDDKNATKVLQSFKLDRERIERIKEERRLQLNEKFRSESFKSEKENSKLKSKSKTELSELKEPDGKISDSLQYKSKSRNEIYNKRDADLTIALAKSASGTGSCGGIDRISQRVRRISDEKNQNCVESTNAADEHNVASKARKFDRRSIDLKREQDNFSAAGTIPSKAILNSQ